MGCLTVLLKWVVGVLDEATTATCCFPFRPQLDLDEASSSSPPPRIGAPDDGGEGEHHTGRADRHAH